MFGILHGVCRCVKGAGGVPVDSNMVGMPVGPAFVERHHYLGAELTDDCYKFPYYLCRVGLGKCTRVLVFGCTRKPELACICPGQRGRGSRETCSNHPSI